MKEWDNKTDRRKSMSGDVDNLKTYMDGKFSVLNEKLDGKFKILDEHHNDLYGVDNDTPGIKLKVDRLEQSKKNSDKHLGVVYGTAVALILKTFWDWITNHK